MADKTATLADAVAQHVRAGDVLHPIVGHTRWTAATREVVRQWWGRDPRLHAGDAVAVEPGRTVLPRAGWCARSSPVTQETRFPTSPPTRGSPARTSGARSRWSTGRSWRSHSDSRPRRAGLPAIVTRSIAGSSMEDERRASPAPTRRSERSDCSRRSCPMSRCMHALVADRAGNVVVHPPLLEGIWGALGAQRGV